MAVNGLSFPVPVFAAVGPEAWGPVQELRARGELRLVPTPRHASILLVAGAVPERHTAALERVHDQLPHPRRSIAWVGRPGAHRLASTVVVGSADDLVQAIVDAHVEVTLDRSRTEADRLPDQEPNEWRGVGPHGQGGEGMMGGTPYGRPMAMTGDDRDGLALDRLDVRLGPFLDALPAGLVLDVTLQGEVLQRVEVERPGPGEPAIGSPLLDDAGPPGAGEARRGLRWLAHALHVHGLDAHAARAASLAGNPDGAPRRHQFVKLRRAMGRSGLMWTLRGVGRIGQRGDAADRWRARLDQIEAALAGASGPEPATPAPSARELADALVGMTLSDAVTTLVSLDLSAAATEGAVAG